MERHPLYTAEILTRVTAFEELVDTAARQHERLDGRGYPWRLNADNLDAAARTLAVADVYEALTADRPYRAPLAPDAALAVMARDRGTRLCAVALDALERAIHSILPSNKYERMTLIQIRGYIGVFEAPGLPSVFDGYMLPEHATSRPSDSQTGDTRSSGGARDMAFGPMRSRIGFRTGFPENPSLSRYSTTSGWIGSRLLVTAVR